MASSSAGSDIFAVLAFLTICGVVLLLLRHYLPLRSAPAFLIVPLFLALALPSSAILLVPIDLAASARTEDESSKGIWLPQRVVLVAWRIIYWLTFMLTWIVLPLLGEYMDAGYRDPRARIIYSLRSNGRYQLIMLACATAGFIYMIFSYGFDFTAIKGLVMALAYVWGLILAIYLMGHGLVAVPRRMLRNADVAGRLRRVQTYAPRIHEKMEDAVINLEDLDAQIAQLKQRKTGTARDFQEWIDDLVDMAATNTARVTLATPEVNSASAVPAVITERYLADLSRRYAHARHQRIRCVDEWDQTVQQATDLQAILDSKASKKLVFGAPSPSSSMFTRYPLLTPYLRYHLYVHVMPAGRLVLGALFSIASVAIVWSEIIRFPAPKLSAVSLTVIHHPNSKDYQIGFGGQLLASAWICYMCLCALSSITVVPVWRQRALVRRNTYAESACWYAGQIAKLTVPLAYNFLTFLPSDIQKQTTFYNFLGRLINLTPLGTWFDYLFPIFILIPVSASLFNLYSKIKRVFGFGFMDDEDDVEGNPSGFGVGGWREGRDLIARDLSGPGRSSAQHTFGLLSSSSSTPRASLDTNNRASATPTTNARTLYIPPTDRSPSPNPSLRVANTASSSNNNTNPQQSRSVQSNRARNAIHIDPEPEEENFFTLFGRRVKNTFDTIEAPRWMQNNSNGDNGGSRGNFDNSSSNDTGFKRPKWLPTLPGNDSTGGEEGNFVDRLFGGNSGGSNNSGGRAGSGGNGRIVL